MALMPCLIPITLKLINLLFLFSQITPISTFNRTPTPNNHFPITLYHLNCIPTDHALTVPYNVNFCSGANVFYREIKKVLLSDVGCVCVICHYLISVTVTTTRPPFSTLRRITCKLSICPSSPHTAACVMLSRSALFILSMSRLRLSGM